MKLAILGSRGFPSTYGGYETLVRRLARDWTKLGHQVTVYCRTRDAGRRTWCAEGVRCIWTPGRDSKSLSTLSFGATSSIDAAFRRYDAVLVLNIANGFFLPLLRFVGTPTVVNTDGIEWKRGKWGPIGRRVFLCGARLTARHSSLLVADSKAIARLWETQFGVPSTFIPYGADVISDPGRDRVAALGLESKSYALVVARLIPENNVELFLDALDEMSTVAPAVVVGSTNYRSDLESRLRSLDHSGRVRWFGHVSDQELLTQLWTNCGAYVHGHSVGGTNPALLQALGAGAPTLALDTEFNREVLSNDEQLFGYDPRQLAERLEMLLANAETQSRFSSYGQAIVDKHYSWEAVSTSYLEALSDVSHEAKA